MSDSAADIDRIWTLMKDIPVAMVVTHEGQGSQHEGSTDGAAPAQRKAQSIF